MKSLLFMIVWGIAGVTLVTSFSYQDYDTFPRDPEDEQDTFRGHTEKNSPHSQGLALILSKEAGKALIEWQAVSPRIIRASFRTSGNKVNMSVIQCYAPTNEKEDSVKEQFYVQLQNTISNERKENKQLLMGDLNAKIGFDNKGYEEIMGTHGVEVMNENGELFATFCADNQYVIGGSIFPHKGIHKATWKSPDQKTTNEIDHICINKKCSSLDYLPQWPLKMAAAKE